MAARCAGPDRHPGKVGIAFRLLGAFLLFVAYHFGSGIWEGVRDAATRAPEARWHEYVPGVTLFGTPVVLLAIGGAVLLTFRRSVVVDLARREVADERSFLGIPRRSVRPLADFGAVALRPLRARTRTSGGGSHASSTAYGVELSKSNRDFLRIAIEPDEKDARGVAERLSRLVGLPLDDRVAREREEDDDEEDDEEEEEGVTER